MEEEKRDKALNIHLEKFDGPLDLLLHLIDKDRVSIYDIPIAEITDQYLAYLDEMEEEDLDTMSSFLIMASTLLDIKSRMLLPKEENEEGEEIDPREDLVRQLIEYKTYRYIADELREREEGAKKVYFRPPSLPKEVSAYEEPVDIGKLTEGVSLKDLDRIFHEVMRRRSDRVDPIRSDFKEIVEEPVTVEERTASVLSYLASHPKTSFFHLLTRDESRTGVIVTFLSVLELMKDGKVVAVQDRPFGDIQIRIKKEVKRNG